eukprot:1193517-Prorocentrum_minimum.AAC.2
MREGRLPSRASIQSRCCQAPAKRYSRHQRPACLRITLDHFEVGCQGLPSRHVRAGPRRQSRVVHRGRPRGSPPPGGSRLRTRSSIRSTDCPSVPYPSTNWYARRTRVMVVRGLGPGRWGSPPRAPPGRGRPSGGSYWRRCVCDGRAPLECWHEARGVTCWSAAATKRRDAIRTNKSISHEHASSEVEARSLPNKGRPKQLTTTH